MVVDTDRLANCLSWDVALILVMMSTSIAFTLGVFFSYIIPSGFPLIWQHIYEFASLFTGITGSIYLYEEWIGEEICNTREFLAISFLGILATLSLKPFIPWQNIVGGRVWGLGILAAVETAVVLLVADILSSYWGSLPRKYMILRD